MNTNYSQNDLNEIKKILSDYKKRNTITKEMSQEEKNAIIERNKPRYIIDPKDVTQKDHNRLSKWGLEVMKKNEFRLSFNKYKDREIVCKGDVDPEDIDIRNLYPFKDLNWCIFRDKQLWSLMLRSRERLLAVLTYANI